ncbi:hypothetical protein [Brevibacterium aurantiacum]|uniref:hypothetical protein n=1 Tax=Brevibacterium aurantiacum TaxID=273384 RepID=UPI000F642FDA|nr:hypothetical protein [Brevibacterium aurantiacum]AZL04633.1 hypothetical protein CXR24_02710 [Brevibacterium aurantiacum]
MTILGKAVLAELQRVGVEGDLDRIEKILLDAGVSSTASRGVPARLRVRRLHVTGTKHYSENVDRNAESAEMKTEPIRLDWTPGNSVNGVGSAANLRGKSSVLHLTMWALTGRSHLQADVISWVDHVYAEFQVDDILLIVDFDVDDITPFGKVEQQLTSGGRAVLGEFAGEAEFESVMGSVMLERLRLDTISVFSNGIETEHAWPSYASALTVHADMLDPIIGNENTLKTRIMQMFVGTRWAAIDAQVATASNSLRYKRDTHKNTQRSVAPRSTVARRQAEERVAAAKKALAEFDPEEPDVDTVFALTSAASDRAREAHSLSLQLMNADTAAAEVRAQLRAEELRQQAAVEDAVARRLFNGMVPTVCPRCSTKIGAERYASEPTTHECSLCLHELDLDEHLENADPVTDDSGDENLNESQREEENEDPVDPLAALRAAVTEAEQGVATLREMHRAVEIRRHESEDAATKARDKINSARARFNVELELARAQSVLDTLRDAVEVQALAPSSDEEDIVLRTASTITKKWVKDDQEPLLLSVSAMIAGLARQFGATNIASVNLKGNGNMSVVKGGAETTYSRLTTGEKLRIKLATVIALIKLGHRDGVGRHPGLLFVDSPAAEEVPEADLKIMLEAMSSVADDTDMQIVVATTHGPMLSAVLPKSNLLVATGTDFVW